MNNNLKHLVKQKKYKINCKSQKNKIYSKIMIKIKNKHKNNNIKKCRSLDQVSYKFKSKN